VRATQQDARSPLLRVREFVMRNDGSPDQLRGCAGMLVAEIDAGRAGMVRTPAAAACARVTARVGLPHRGARCAAAHARRLRRLLRAAARGARCAAHATARARCRAATSLGLGLLPRHARARTHFLTAPCAPARR
jgi:hypothetical protein